MGVDGTEAFKIPRDVVPVTLVVPSVILIEILCAGFGQTPPVTAVTDMFLKAFLKYAQLLIGTPKVKFSLDKV